MVPLLTGSHTLKKMMKVCNRYNKVMAFEVDKQREEKHHWEQQQQREPSPITFEPVLKASHLG